MKDIELPPLPDSGQNGNQTTDYFGKLFEYTRQDMRSYARAAVEADRAQRVTDGYDQGSAECMAAVQEILDGKDRGDGVAREPWESIRRRLIALVAPAPAQQERRPMTDEQAADDYFGRSEVAENPENRAFQGGTFECFLGGIRFAERHHGIKE